jgi:hypothetical protein
MDGAETVDAEVVAAESESMEEIYHSSSSGYEW